MSFTKMDGLVRVPVDITIPDDVNIPESRVVTLGYLIDSGCMELRKVDNMHNRKGPVYFADFKGTTRGYEIRETAYKSRTGQAVSFKP